MNQPLAYVHPGAKIAKNVVIEPFTTIHNNVTIGEGTWIGSNVTIMEGARIGKNCSIFPGAVISAMPQDLKYQGEETTVVIGDNTTIRECATINKGTSDRMKTVIGNNCLIMAYCHVAHDCFVGDGCIFSNNSTLAGHVTIGQNVVLAGMVAVHQFVSIGNHAFVTGGSLVRKDVPPYVKAAREPLSYVGINSIGLRRRGFESDKIREIQNIYRLLYQQNYNNSQAASIIEAEMEATPERDEILQFIRDSQRGIMKGYFSSN
ncbi:MAG TPA: acyl-ACP--UDP-N-acetylglucosamine O-acyltransferase [Muricauda sp.]|mgnify:CR=1 FL=1|jgi:UDP-N-acetylglucosamine acyltransferase|uniref:Acyl-ACP--UDP-N-acetylglucosamine O-acyltransferase n=4 Tax=Flagellimonas TaxID=444459 RepID=A0A850NFX2_9FLAO|nr:MULTISPECIES: acyl-ACP--UDP-N-acetylglucosamine O-acyltransferase [Allomuricauda]MAO18662.1 acyl-[acyl-carrier-protein]--UDP-N-acetylglucosamine O-acyltransferase [Allomuricauda sp.]UBZ13768.1 acyl-ACP--UDP-N-acetylglucosamine O-acyltransferase [Allomuricauda aquimarina]MBC71440.1 acyl-[acyl-carrier-protein]--UDP-N-acetylglucosamine O-acyltransferase [Allomuricauda sp.]MBO0353113.1 acyl-ACP--UDP-N-acetylglucosamine O-acyltransferase [Allomuricauda aurea]MBW8198407.1 acyl-ACP--UDP-N-acetylgl|tara:strand:+ start:204 stop:989 length:786 start_codon:yes stop_codon:yes gene_type:complete